MITPLAEALSERGFDKLTPVQEAVSAPELATLDLLVSAQTGSGKTVGFGLAIAPTLLGEEERFGPAAAPLALVVAPTRELAFQVMRELKWLYAQTGAVVTSCVGGMEMRQERRALDRGAHIVVGTPGRLRDHIERGSLDLGDLRAVVLDEADEMLDLGFREDLEFMLGAAPEERRTLLFSATVPPMIAKLAQQYQRDARRISTISKNDQHADIAYQAVRVSDSDSEHAIFNLLRFHDDQGAIVFANTRAAVNHLTARLANRGLATVCLSGELSQSERTHALQSMRDGRARVCVATDVAARGIDLPNLTLVIHADLPTNTESLLHRSGRTGRAGRKGISALIVPPKAVKKAERLLKWAKITAEWTVAPSAEEITQKDEERLLSDPAWSEPLTEDQTNFATKLLERHSPEVVAAAYLRLYQSRLAAPEELLPPDTKPAKREKREPREPRDFGPSRWFSLSVGRDDRAEARWLLPLLCRAGDLDKSAIGAIRVQDAETYVELTEASAEGFLAALGSDGVLEEGITARQLDAAPDLSRSAPPKREGASAPRPYKSREDRPDRRKPASEGSYRDADRPARKPRASAASAKSWDQKSRREDDGKPVGGKREHASKRPAGGPRAAAGPDAAKRAVRKDDKPRKKHGDKPFGGSAGKTAGAGDTSKRFTPPGKSGPGGRKPGRPVNRRDGGNEPPRHGKR